MIGNTNYGVLGFRGADFAAITLENPTLGAFEPHVALDGSDFVFKIGDGIRAYNDLPAINGGVGGGGSYIEADGPTPPTGQPDGTIWYNTAPAV